MSMIKSLDHIALICSSEQTVEFYERLGFAEVSRENRGYDSIVYLSSYGIDLELYIDPTHPQRIDKPEANGLRHMGFRVDDVAKTVEWLKAFDITAEPIREKDGKHFTFFRDPDGQPIEIKEG